MEHSETCEGGYVRDSRCEVIQVRVPGFLSEPKVGNMARWSIFSRLNIRAPFLESNLIEFNLREEMSLAPVDP